jgi:hypothetical protein
LSRKGAIPLGGKASSWTKEKAIDEAWQTIEAKEPSLEIGLHFVVEKESIASMAEHSISTATPASCIECMFVGETFSSSSIEESLSSIECKVAAIED